MQIWAVGPQTRSLLMNMLILTVLYSDLTPADILYITQEAAYLPPSYLITSSRDPFYHRH